MVRKSACKSLNVKKKKPKQDCSVANCFIDLTADLSSQSCRANTTILAGCCCKTGRSARRRKVATADSSRSSCAHPLCRLGVYATALVVSDPEISPSAAQKIDARTNARWRTDCPSEPAASETRPRRKEAFLTTMLVEKKNSSEE